MNTETNKTESESVASETFRALLKKKDALALAISAIHRSGKEFRSHIHGVAVECLQKAQAGGSTGLVYLQALRGAMDKRHAEALTSWAIGHTPIAWDKKTARFYIPKKSKRAWDIDQARAVSPFTWEKPKREQTHTPKETRERLRAYLSGFDAGGDNDVVKACQYALNVLDGTFKGYEELEELKARNARLVVKLETAERQVEILSAELAETKKAAAVPAKKAA